MYLFRESHSLSTGDGVLKLALHLLLSRTVASGECIISQLLLCVCVCMCVCVCVCVYVCEIQLDMQAHMTNNRLVQSYQHSRRHLLMHGSKS